MTAQRQLPAPIAPTVELLPAATAAPTLNLFGLILTGLAPTSAAGFLADYKAWSKFTGDTSPEAAVWRLFQLPQHFAIALVLAYHAAMSDRGLSSASIARKLAALRRAVRRGRSAGLTVVSLDEVESPRADSLKDCSGPGAKGWRLLFDQAVAEADVGANGTTGGIRNLALLLLLRDRALRRGEAVALDYPDDLDLTRPAIRILGKGRASKEWCSVNERTRDALARWVERRGDWPGALFVRCDPAAAAVPTRLSGKSANELVQAVARRAGLARHTTAHALRHEAITAALDGGFDVRDVKQFSRHRKIDTVLIYDDSRKDVAGEITRALGRPKRHGRKSS